FFICTLLYLSQYFKEMNILILSRNPALYSTQSLVRAGASRGHFIQVYDHFYCDFYIESGNMKIYHNGYQVNGIHAIIPRIGASVTDLGSLLIRQFESMGIYSSLSSDSLLKARNKLSALQILAASGIPVPKTISTAYSEDLSGFLSLIDDYPLIIKLVNSTHGIGVVKAATRTDAVAIMEAFIQMKGRALAQEFIRESEGIDIRSFVVGNKVVASMERRAQEGEFRSNLHRGAEAVSIELTQEEIDISLQSAKALGLNIAGVDLLRSKHGPVVIEVNASPGLEGIEGATGVDVAMEIIKFLEKQVKE
ncbi:MAG TPA: RimK family alpha-L-glutamate ligase, partial [Saprospiraceae bacterium]|nr:RimK family alpha-L-glutamate ligase [Saprospiraceae bacterium]